jgi:hypothetical protein
MDLKELEKVVNYKLKILLERDVDIKVFQGYTNMFMPTIKFYYKNDVIYEFETGIYNTHQLIDIEHSLLTYPNDPMTLTLIDKIVEYDKNSWYVFLAP